MVIFLSGASMLAAAGCGVVFLKSWRTTRDRLFLLFALAFFFLSLEKWAQVLLTEGDETRSLTYVVRLSAFLLIAVAIVDKNRKREQ